MDKFILGLALGMAGGAIIVANNCKLRNLVKKNQEDVMQKVEQYIDTKLGGQSSSSSSQDSQNKGGKQQKAE